MPSTSRGYINPDISTMNSIANYILTHLPELNQELVRVVAASFETNQYNKGTILLRQGEVCNHLYFMEEGICRYYSLKDGNDITTWFSFKNEFVTSFTSFFPRDPSYENIEVTTPSELHSLSYASLQKLKEQSNEVEKIINHFIVDYTLQLERRLFSIQNHTATEKYTTILKHDARLVNQIPGKHLASYLGVSRETLSRIRSSIY